MVQDHASQQKRSHHETHEKHEIRKNPNSLFRVFRVFRGDSSPLVALALVLALCGVGSSATADAPLADAAEKADWPRVRALLQDRADANAAQVDGMTALHWAAHHDDPDTAKLLLTAGASAKAENRYGVTPLALACTNGNADLVRVLLAAG